MASVDLAVYVCEYILQGYRASELHISFGDWRRGNTMGAGAGLMRESRGILVYQAELSDLPLPYLDPSLALHPILSHITHSQLGAGLKVSLPKWKGETLVPEPYQRKTNQPTKQSPSEKGAVILQHTFYWSC